MTTLDNILKFIELKGISVREFERLAGITRSTISSNKKRGVELSSDNVEKIVDKFSTELKTKGFEIVDLSTIGGQGFLIKTKENMSQSSKNENKANEPNLTMEALLKIINANEMLVKSNADITTSNVEIAASNRILAETNRKLADRIVATTASVPEQIHQVFAAKLHNFQELLMEIAMGKKYASKDEVSSLLNKVDLSNIK